MNNDNNTYNVCFAYDWEYDKEFIDLLIKKAKVKNLDSYIVDNKNLDATICSFKEKKIEFNFLFDRASDTSIEFSVLNNLFLERNIPVFEVMEKLNWANDKATMHLEFISNGINTPYSIIIPPYRKIEKIYISVADLAKLGRPFIIKPATNSGGGIGVVSGAETLQDILLARQEYAHDKYLLQEMIYPLKKDNKSFWFRGFYSCGLSQCTWWNPKTHIYELLTEQEKNNYELEPIFDVINKIAFVCKLKFFSTEIVLNTEGKFIVVDYVNITSDMRLKSLNKDGVPDEVVEKISESITDFIKNFLK